jgi:hypothetical protein
MSVSFACESQAEETARFVISRPEKARPHDPLDWQ